MTRKQAAVTMLLLAVLAAAVFFVLSHRKDQPVPNPITSAESPAPAATPDVAQDPTAAP